MAKYAALAVLSYLAGAATYAVVGYVTLGQAIGTRKRVSVPIAVRTHGASETVEWH